MSPVMDCPCGCGWTKHVIINRFSIAEIDAMHGFRDRQIRCWSEYNRAIRKGELVRMDHCERCGRRTGTQGHHADYDKPLDVEWLCGTCHFEADQERRERDHHGVALAPGLSEHTRRTAA